eukprot:1717329-Pyramimonas_sp.AAC.1
METCAQWLDQVMNDMAKRNAIPLITTDLNGALLLHDDERVAGPYANGKEYLSTKRRRPLLCGWNLRAASI